MQTPKLLLQKLFSPIHLPLLYVTHSYHTHWYGIRIVSHTDAFTAPPQSFFLPPPQPRSTGERHIWHPCVCCIGVAQEPTFSSMWSSKPCARHTFGPHHVDHLSISLTKMCHIHPSNDLIRTRPYNSFLGEPSPRFGPQPIRRASLLVRHRGVCSRR